MSDNELPKLSPEAEREATISLAVGNAISAGYDFISQKLDGLHERGFTDDEVVKALRDQSETDILDWYAEWADIDIREDDNTTMDPVVPDPGDAPSYSTMADDLAADGINDSNLLDAIQAVAEQARAEEPDHAPCCSAHGVTMSCERYRRTHFVEVRPCCAKDAERLRAEA